MSLTTPDQATLRSRFEAAGKVLKLCKVNDRYAESNYAITYQALVREGLVGQIKAKYRKV